MKNQLLLLILFLGITSCTQKETFTCFCISGGLNGGFQSEQHVEGKKGKGQEACDEHAAKLGNTQCTLK